VANVFFNRMPDLDVDDSNDLTFEELDLVSST
jgi:hypothetical protein